MTPRLVAALSLGLSMLAGCGRVEDKVQASRGSDPARTQNGRIVLPAGSPKLNRVRVEPVRLAEFALDEVVVPAKVEVNPNRVSRVLTPVGGRVRQVFVKLGDSVEAGQPLLTVESAEAGAALAAYAQTQAQIRQARSALAKAESDLSRFRDLQQHRAAALKEVIAAENEVVQAQAALDQATAAAGEALLRLQMLGLEPGQHQHEVTVRAPLAGKVLEIGVAPGEFRNDTAASLMTIADLHSVWVAGQVPESQIRLIQIGEAVRVELSAYPGEVFRARVMRIADTVDPQTRTIKVQAEIPNPAGRLRPEMFGQIFHSHGVEPKPAVPISAVVQTEGRSVVLVEEQPGVFREQAVTLGERKGDLAPVLSGLTAGQRVVVDGVMLLRGAGERE